MVSTLGMRVRDKLEGPRFNRVFLSFVLSMAKICGVLPVTAEKDMESGFELHFETNFIGMAISIWHLVYAFGCLYYFYPIFAKDVLNEKALSIPQLVVNCSVPLMSVYVICLTIFYRRTKMHMLLDSLVVLISDEIPAMKRTALLTVIFLFAFVLRLCLVSSHEFSLIFLFLSNLPLFASDLMFSSVCLLMAGAYREINVSLASVEKLTPKKQGQVLIRAIEKHTEVTKTVSILEDSYCFDFIALFGFCLIHTVHNTYTLLNGFMFNTPTSSTPLLAVSCHICLLAGRFMYVCYSTSALSRQGKETMMPLLVYKLNSFGLITGENEQLLEIFIAQLNKRSVKLSACNIFDVNLSLFSAFAETCMTLIIVAIQFNDGEW